jgi:hypothetical protein
VSGEAQASPLLVHAAQCLTAKQFVQPTGGSTLRFGYVVDDESYPGEKVLYVVEYKSRTTGWVFAIFLKDEGTRQVFDIQNNASFFRSKRDEQELEFQDPPLGGVWTQTHLKLAIRKSDRIPAMRIPVSELTALDSGVLCMAYGERR